MAKSIRNKIFFLSFSFLFVTACVVSACSKNEDYVKCEGVIWNTSYHITYKGPKSLQDSIIPVMNRVSRSLSVFDKNSLVSLLNILDSLKVDSIFITVFDASKKIHEYSGGKFDPTVGPLIDAWGFGINHTPTSDTLLIDSIRSFVGFDKTYRHGEWIVKEDIRTRFNFSAIAKGYGCDALGEMFHRNGVKDFMVEIGGELTLSGKSPLCDNWRIAIDAPMYGNNPGDMAALVISISDSGVATSGNYRNYREEDSKKIGHTISPLSGLPFESDILSATVIAPSCMEADALATACMAGTSQEAISLLDSINLPGLLILTSDSVYISPSFQKFIVP